MQSEVNEPNRRRLSIAAREERNPPWPPLPNPGSRFTIDIHRISFAPATVSQLGIISNRIENTGEFAPRPIGVSSFSSLCKRNVN